MNRIEYNRWQLLPFRFTMEYDFQYMHVYIEIYNLIIKIHLVLISGHNFLVLFTHYLYSNGVQY